MLWRAFRFRDLFELDSSYNTKTNNKDLNISEMQNDFFNLMLINKGGQNNGIEGYIERLDKYNICKKGLTMDDQFGNCFYHNNEFIMTGGGHINVILLNNKLNELISREELINYFFAAILRKIFKGTGIYGYGYKITDERPNREIILLPIIEVTNNDEYIWNIDNKHYTLAVNTMSYLYLQGQVNINQKKIDNYTYKY